MAWIDENSPLDNRHYTPTQNDHDTIAAETESSPDAGGRAKRSESRREVRFAVDDKRLPPTPNQEAGPSRQTARTAQETTPAQSPNISVPNIPTSDQEMNNLRPPPAAPGPRRAPRRIYRDEPYIIHEQTAPWTLLPQEDHPGGLMDDDLAHPLAGGYAPFHLPRHYTAGPTPTIPPLFAAAGPPDVPWDDRAPRAPAGVPDVRGNIPPFSQSSSANAFPRMDNVFLPNAFLRAGHPVWDPLHPITRTHRDSPRSQQPCHGDSGTRNDSPPDTVSPELRSRERPACETNSPGDGLRNNTTPDNSRTELRCDERPTPTQRPTPRQRNEDREDAQTASAQHQRAQAKTLSFGEELNTTVVQSPNERYKLRGRLGSGTSGTVFCAENSRGQSVAIKLASKAKHYALGRKARRMLLAEKDIMVRATEQQVPCIAYLVESWSDKWNVYFVMKLYHRSLATYLLEAPDHFFPFSTYAAEMILMLDSLHTIGAIHNDIKPDHILVSSDGHLALADFSIGRLADQDHKPDSQWRAWYGAPECGLEPSTGVPAGHPADVWSIGICMLEMYCHNGQHLFETNRLMMNMACDDVVEMAVMHYLRGHNPLFWDLICKMTDRDPEMRSTPAQLKNHPFFHDVDWVEIAAQRTPLASLSKPSLDTLDKRVIRLDLMQDQPDKAQVNVAALSAMLAEAEASEDEFQWPRARDNR